LDQGRLRIQMQHCGRLEQSLQLPIRMEQRLAAMVSFQGKGEHVQVVDGNLFDRWHYHGANNDLLMLLVLETATNREASLDLWRFQLQ